MMSRGARGEVEPAEEVVSFACALVELFKSCGGSAFLKRANRFLADCIEDVLDVYLNFFITVGVKYVI